MNSDKFNDMNTVIGLIQSSLPFILVGEAAEKVLTGENLTDSDKRDFIRANLLAYLNANPDLVFFLNSLFSSKNSYKSVSEKYLLVFILISGGGGFFDLLQLLGDPRIDSNEDHLKQAIKDVTSANSTKYYNQLSSLYNKNRKNTKKISPNILTQALLGYSKFINDTFRIIFGHELTYFKYEGEDDLRQVAIRVFKESFDIKHSFTLISVFILKQLSTDPFTGWELFRRVKDILEDLRLDDLIDTILDYSHPVDLNRFEGEKIEYDPEDLFDVIGDGQIIQMPLSEYEDEFVSIYGSEEGLYLTVEQPLPEEVAEQMEVAHPEIFALPNRQSSFFWSVENRRFYSAEDASEIKDPSLLHKLISVIYTHLSIEKTDNIGSETNHGSTSTSNKKWYSMPEKGSSGRYQPSRKRGVPVDIGSQIEYDLSGAVEEVLFSVDINSNKEVMETINKYVLPNYIGKITSFTIKHVKGQYIAEFSIRGSKEILRRILITQKTNVTGELELKFASNAWSIRFYVSGNEIRISSKGEQGTDLQFGGTRSGEIIYKEQ